jgi:hypothetical protein
MAVAQFFAARIFVRKTVRFSDSLPGIKFYECAATGGLTNLFDEPTNFSSFFLQTKSLIKAASPSSGQCDVSLRV